MSSIKQAAPAYPIQELISQRWSPYAFSAKAVSKADLCSLFEAMRWAASSYNEQPWAYILATRDEPAEYDRVLSCLVESNQVWAKAAPVLAIGCVSLTFQRNGKPNPAAMHDLGLAAGNLCAEATARGLCVHQMIGILPDRVRELFAVPASVQPLTGLAIGYASEPDDLPENLKQRDLTPRQRKPLSEFIFSGQWGSTSRSVSEGE